MPAQCSGMHLWREELRGREILKVSSPMSAGGSDRVAGATSDVALLDLGPNDADRSGAELTHVEELRSFIAVVELKPVGVGLVSAVHAP